MSTDDSWTVVSNKKKARRENRKKYISESLAYKLQSSMDITNLADVLLSTESRNLQEDGWSFDSVLKKDEDGEIEDPQDTEEYEYMWLPVPNKWGDRALFSRRLYTDE